MHNVTSPRNDEQALEAEIQAKASRGLRLTPENIDEQIVKEEYHWFAGSTVTVCMLTLRNGYNTVGHSACVDPRNFNSEIGRRIARVNAREQIWALEGYALRQYIHDNSLELKMLAANANGTAADDLGAKN